MRNCLLINDGANLRKKQELLNGREQNNVFCRFHPTPQLSYYKKAARCVACDGTQRAVDNASVQ